MKMEKRYYTKSKEELEEIRAELQAEREAMTEEEWLAEQLENERGFQRLMERCNLRRTAATGAFASGHPAEPNGHLH